MNKTLSTTLIVIAVLALAGGVFFTGIMFARTYAYGPAMMFEYGNNKSSDSGMMGGNSGYGMMGGYGSNNGFSSKVTPLTVDQAKAAAEIYVQSINLKGLKIGEVMIFDNNSYVVVKESGTDLGAFELLVDPSSQTAYPEYGPNMMWNLKYGGLNHNSMTSGQGMMGANNMMSGWDYKATPSATVSAEMTVSPEQATEYAQKYLDANNAGATAATDPMQFYGYYTLDFEKDGKVAGMLSVNGYNGQIFLHTWHGTFIEDSK